MRDDFTLDDAVSRDAGPGNRSFTDWFFGHGADDGGDPPPDAAPPDPPPETRSPTEPSATTEARHRDSGAGTSARLSENRSPTERVFAGEAATGAWAPPRSGELAEIGSLGEAFLEGTADAGEADAGTADGAPEFPSPGELFFRHPASEAGPDDATAAAQGKVRSLGEAFPGTTADPGEADAGTADGDGDSDGDDPPAPNPWRRSADHEEREARADLIADLVARWELGTVHRLHALAASHGLDVREFLVLSELVARPAGLTASQLTGVVGGGAARMSVLLRGLEERGLVERDPDPFDSRSVLVGASDRAREFLPHRAAPELRRFVRHEFGGGDRADAVAHLLGVAGLMAYGNARDLRDGHGLV